MAAVAFTRDLPAARSERLFARSRRDAWPLCAAVAYGLFVTATVALSPRGLAAAACVALVALGTVWVSNTTSHIHLHTPIFTSRRLNRLFSLLLTAALLIPQTYWKRRHFWHHAGEPSDGAATRRVNVGSDLLIEVALVIAVLAVGVAARPWAVLAIVLPGLVGGLALARVQGYFEHAGDPDVRTSGVSAYGWLYNTLWFNDGYHAEHHARPSVHWTELPTVTLTLDHPRRTSSRAPVLRWLDAPPGALRCAALSLLETTVFASPVLQRWVVGAHLQATARLLSVADRRELRRVAIVGGGLFPRTVLVLRALAPHARLTVIDSSSESLERAARFFASRGEDAPMSIAGSFDPEVHRGFDLVIFPLALVGHPALVQRAAETSRAVLAHGWLWQAASRSGSAVVSLWLFKRLNRIETPR